MCANGDSLDFIIFDGEWHTAEYLFTHDCIQFHNISFSILGFKKVDWFGQNNLFLILF